MTHKVKAYFLVAVLLLLTVAAYILINPDFSSFSFLHRTNQSVTKGPYILNVNVLTAQTLALQEASMLGVPANSSGFDSLEAKYSTSLYLDLKISPETPQSGSRLVSALGASGEQEFKLKSYLLNFRLQDFISLQTRDTTYQPVLSKAVIMPNNDEVRIRMAFPVNTTETTLNSILTFSDPIWNTGETRFNF